ncbi:hypothetical protein L0M14_06275 [Paenibacillus hexagrammi]|uniref:Uncharacterized protein n=1 Tax=Paenibacillus hexagrammi TaxID=2908839 RepID=A0ABY3SNG7_9BACL|nr:hypothetical protein [Paenibacillus sp. YPD9-1]UJF34761.1 hypothetical protein L0M14_06275 [Paenibacillus sp. YPD9-1]
MSTSTTNEDLDKAIDLWISNKKYEELLDLWVKGMSMDWNRLYPGIKPHRVSLPTYPFAKERYWVPENKIQSETNPISSQNKAQLDDLLYEQLIDQVLEDSITIDVAVRKVKEFMEVGNGI